MVVWELAVLIAIVVAAVKAIEGEFKYWIINYNEKFDRIWLYLRAVGVVVVTYLSYAVLEPPETVLIALTAIVAGLGVLGYYPEIQQIGYRLQGRSGVSGKVEPLATYARKQQ